MDLLNKLTIKNLKLNKKRTIVTIIGIILSVALITAVATMYLSGIQSLKKFEINQKGNFHIAFCDVPQNEINTLKNNRNIEEMYIVKNVGYAKLEGLKNKNKPYVYVKQLSTKSLENLAIRLKEGRLPENENEILIPTHLKNNGRIELNVGEEITLNIGKRISNGEELNQSNSYNENEEEIIDTIPKTYKIVGIIERPANTVEPYSAPGYTFISYIDENNISGKVDIYTKYTKKGIKNNEKITADILGIDPNLFTKFSSGNDINEDEIETITNEMKKAKYEIIENNYLINLEKNPLSENAVNGLGTVAEIICIIIVITSVFCIRNSFSISITEKIKQYGMLRSIGATKKQIKRNVLYEAMILGAIGIPIGIVCGNLASYILIIVSNYLLNETLTDGLRLYFSISWIAIIAAIILGIITIYLSAIGSAKKAAKISPIEAIKNSANIKIKAKNIKKSRIINKIFGIGGTISYKNLKRSKKKYRTTIISIIVSVAVFIVVSSFIQLAFLDLSNNVEKSNYNLSLDININKDESLYKKVVETTKIDGIENSTIQRNIKIDIENPKYNPEYINYLGDDEQNSIDIVAIGTEQYKKYTKKLGLDYEKVKDKGILLDYCEIVQYDTNKAIKKHEREFTYKEDQKIKGKLSTKEQTDTEIEIAKIAKEGPFGMEKNYQSSIIVSDEWYNTHINEEDYFVYILYKAENADKAQDEIDEILKGEDYSIYNRDESYRAAENLFILIGVFLYGFIIVISLIGVTNIFNTITTNMELRKPEFAMLKSIGMTKKEFKKMVSLESIFIGIKSLIFGIPIGIVLSYTLYHYMISGYGGFAYPFPIVPIIIAVIVVFLLITCIMKYSINKINKQNTIETIRNENI